MMGSFPGIEALFAFLVAALVSFALVFQTHRTWSRLTRQGDLGAIQAAHSTPTPRLGGFAILLGIFIPAIAALPGWNSVWVLLGLASLPLFLSGAAEDLGYGVAPVGRLGAALLSSTVALWVSGYWISATGIPGLDRLLEWSPLAIVMTVFAASTIAHAYNLIDGLNGLAGFAALSAAIGLAGIAYTVGDNEIAVFAATLSGAILGFLVFNFPFGRIFFGDAGAYTVGFLLAWLCISLVARNEAVTPLAMMLIVFWPLADLSLAIYRRWRRHMPVSAPDRLHFHQLVMRGLEIEFFGRSRRRIANPVATTLILPMIVVPALTGCLLHASPFWAAVAVAVYFGLFYMVYGLGIRFATRRTRALTPKDKIPDAAFATVP